MDKAEMGSRRGRKLVEVLEVLGEVEHRGRIYRLVRVRVQETQYLSLRLYNAQGKFIKQFMVEPEIATSVGKLLIDADPKEIWRRNPHLFRD